MLVFGTLHTNNAAKTIDRIVDAFPAEEQNMVRMSLSESLAGIVSQLLVPTADGKGRVATNEILLKTAGLPNVVREGNTQMLYSIIQSGEGRGHAGDGRRALGVLRPGSDLGQGRLHEGHRQGPLREAPRRRRLSE